MFRWLIYRLHRKLGGRPLWQHRCPRAFVFSGPLIISSSCSCPPTPTSRPTYIYYLRQSKKGSHHYLDSTAVRNVAECFLSPFCSVRQTKCNCITRHPSVSSSSPYFTFIFLHCFGILGSTFVFLLIYFFSILPVAHVTWRRS